MPRIDLPFTIKDTLSGTPKPKATSKPSPDSWMEKEKEEFNHPLQKHSDATHKRLYGDK